ncbi:hypothetical protein [Dyadobacter sp. CY312]|uniref:hypothetical protein n=1 Tax=Dyadobacter sp. CY312 TaxID=2907303 RepID=UPI001F373D21|nr:hypothetical protein [Dyadobacter sp. CY312]MCE7044674.1 hypothetical protein [Dyadobacter sp. CY312]
MRQKHPEESLGSLCDLFGVTRQAYYDAAEHEKKTSIAHMLVLSLVREYRSNIPFIGTRKLLFLLIPDLTQQLTGEGTLKHLKAMRSKRA